MSSFFAWLALAFLPILRAMGLSTWTLEEGQRYRMRLLVSRSAREMGQDGGRASIRRAFESAGFAQVDVYLSPAELPADWVGSGVGSARPPKWLAWVEATWSQATQAVNPPWVDFQVARSDLATPPPKPAVSAPAAVSNAATDPTIAPPAAAVVATAHRPTRPDVKLTRDHSWGFYEKLVAIGQRHGWKPINMLMVSQSEAEMLATAHNPRGDASGLIQFMPATLEGLGFPGTAADLRALSAEDQLPWVEKYYVTRPHMPPDPDAAAFYVATFLPVHLPHANDPDFVLAIRGSQNYEQNAKFDTGNTGVIRVSDLSRAIARRASGARWLEAVNRLRFVEAQFADPMAGVAVKAGVVVGAAVALGGAAWLAWEHVRG